MGRHEGDFRATFPPPRRMLKREEAALYVGVGTSKFDEMVTDGRMPKPSHIDRRVLWDVRKLDFALDAIVDQDSCDADSFADFQ